MEFRRSNPNILFVGNPGTGKSTMLNCILGKAMFKSGNSFNGSGITTMLQLIVHQGVNYLDTPGLDDDELKQKCADEINCALKKSGIYYICFVVTLEAGRVRPADKATIKLVLESAPQIQSNYSIIINKLDEDLYDYYKKNPDVPATFLNRGIRYSTQSIYFMKDKPELKGKSNVVPEFDKEFADWIRNAPGVEIAPEQVSKIAIDQFENQRKFFEIQIQQLKAQLDSQQQSFLVALKEEKERALKQHEQVLVQQELLRKEYATQIANIQNQLAEAKAQKSNRDCTLF